MTFSDSNMAWMRHPKTYFRCSGCEKEFRDFDDLVEHLTLHQIFVMRNIDLSVSDKVEIQGSL